jgi:Fe-S-cluster containining protein
MSPPSEGRSPSGTPLEFFHALQSAFAATLAAHRERPGLIDAVLSRAFDCFDGNVALQRVTEPPIECHKGCATCCTMRVTATAPEVLLIARVVRASAPRFARLNVDLAGAVADADAATRGLDERQRLALRRRCPFIVNAVCAIYPARPLACRGLASHSKRACVDAAAGRAADVPTSAAYLEVRSVVQNAMQSALRDAGYAWSAYELNHALTIAFETPQAEVAWAGGADPFAAARADEVSAAEMASTFDRIKVLTRAKPA